MTATAATEPSTRRPITVLLATPRGFCAGVDRAIQIVERTIEKYGAPVYVRHEIVHNRHVVERLKALGAVFVEELSECPSDRPVVFSAHGVPKSAPPKEAIGHATPNRQEAVKSVAARSDVLLVLGSANSSNSVRLAEVGQRAGASAYLIDDADSLDLAWLAGASVVGVTAGASAPELLVQGVIERLSQAFDVSVEEIDAARETVSFKLPRVLA